jgi:anthranilate synthase component 2
MILIIDNYDSFTYNLYQAVAAINPDVKVVRNDKITVKEIAALNPEAIIISPGPGRPEAAGIGVELVKKLGNKIPILGICLGHQIITVAYGGKVVLAEQPIHGKSAFIFHTRQGLYENMPLPFEAARYHSLITEKQGLPEELVVEAESDKGMVMGIRHRDYPVFGFQFHPESILTPEGNTLIGNFLSQIEAR